MSTALAKPVGRRGPVRVVGAPLLVLLAAVVALCAPALAGSAAAATNPSAGPFPTGTNTCVPTSAHPNPVVLVHGTFENAAQNFATLAPYLQAKGYCVYALNYGNNATGDINASAQQLSTFVDFVLTQTGASKVDIVGHSQGGLMPRDYINNFGGAGKVDKLVGLSPSNHGTTNPLAPSGGQGCVACVQQVYQSSFIHSVNDAGETRSGIFYTNIETKYDEVVTPYTSAFLNGGENNAQVTNVLLQTNCPANVDDHIATAYDPTVFLIVDNALSQGAAPSDPAFNACAPPVSTTGPGTTPTGSGATSQSGAGHTSTTSAPGSAATAPESAATGGAPAVTAADDGTAPAATPVSGTPNFAG